MLSDTEIARKFWKSLKSDRTFMLGLTGELTGDAQPMTANMEQDESGPIWVFTSKDTDFAHALGPAAHLAIGQFASKGHDLFATFHGELVVNQDRAVINRLWNPFIAAWYSGKDDPKLLLLRFDVSHAHIWLNETSLFAGVKVMFGADPKNDHKDKTADIAFT
jgi:general stress protein 26